MTFLLVLWRIISRSWMAWLFGCIRRWLLPNVPREWSDTQTVYIGTYSSIGLDKPFVSMDDKIRSSVSFICLFFPAFGIDGDVSFTIVLSLPFQFIQFDGNCRSSTFANKFLSIRYLHSHDVAKYSRLSFWPGHTPFRPTLLARAPVYQKSLSTRALQHISAILSCTSMSFATSVQVALLGDKPISACVLQCLVSLSCLFLWVASARDTIFRVRRASNVHIRGSSKTILGRGPSHQTMRTDLWRWYCSSRAFWAFFSHYISFAIFSFSSSSVQPFQRQCTSAEPRPVTLLLRHFQKFLFAHVWVVHVHTQKVGALWNQVASTPLFVSGKLDSSSARIHSFWCWRTEYTICIRWVCIVLRTVDSKHR